MKNIKFFRTGEIVRDIGIVNLYRILKNEDYNAVLKDNYLEINGINSRNFYRIIVENVLFKIAIDGINIELTKGKKELINKDNINFENYKKFVDNSDYDDKTKKMIINKIESQYIPYLRNSGKFGANAGNVENFHNNLKKFLEIVFEEKSEEFLNNEYEKIETKCSICHNNYVYKYDITHKEEKKERKTSKYLYSFMGSENNMFNNYGQDLGSNICFECEFFNIMFLLYINENRNSELIYVESLKLMEFFNYKYNLISRELRNKGFLSSLSDYRNNRFKLYGIERDSNKGIIINLNSVLDINNMIKSLKIKAIIDSFYITSSTKKELYRLVDYKNYNIILKYFLANLIFQDEKEKSIDMIKTKNNVRIFLKFIKFLYGGDLEMSEEKIKYFEDNNKFRSSGYSLGKILNVESKKSIIYKLNNYLKTLNRKGLLEMIIHLLTVNSDAVLPKDLANSIMKSTENDLYYNVGLFIEGLLQPDNTNKKGENK
ncbi:MAG: hypothetical protein PWP28_2523 [Oceanotoga sp.]|uniref:hypothetical protein n=1 Tax=Oceanotoga sp. TaxID=2108366 RepID=UPI0026549698|nr:hypothetical protein [Oceanotoga sp.]MDN5343643.1 hypothetical protein [Oceanotoga sp.]